MKITTFFYLLLLNLALVTAHGEIVPSIDNPMSINISYDSTSIVSTSEITPVELKEKMDRHDEMALIDVREDHEVNRDGTPLFPDHGYIPGAIHMSKGVIERDIERAIPNFDTSIIVYCSDGSRSAMVIESLKKLGYTNISSLKNGSQGWIAAGYSMEENSPIIEPTQIHKDHSAGFLKLTSDAKSEIQQITAVELKEKLDHHDEITLIDVREDREWEAPLSLGGGHIPGAIHISRGMIDQDIAKKAPDLNTSIVVYCSGGFRGALVAQSLQKMGYTNVKSLEGGSRGWIAAGYQPLLEE